MGRSMSLHEQFKSAYAKRFGPPADPPGQTRRDLWWDRFSRLVLFLLFLLGVWFYLLWTPVSWSARVIDRLTH